MDVTGYDLRTEWVDDMQRSVDSNWAVKSEESFRLTQEGLRFADLVAEWFIRPDL